MALSLLQLTLALTPAIIAGLVINKMRMPWDKEKRPSERAEILCLLAKDIKRVKSILARNIIAVNSGRACPALNLPLLNWKRIKQDARLKKYSDEKIFRQMISQFREWEKIAI